MAINKVNTTAEAKDFKFQQNKSTILNISSTNRFVFNGVNVVVEKPKVGDIMCVTRYKNGGGLLPADEQEVIWIDGLSIELNQLSSELEPVGICVAINGNKAIVRYKEEFNNVRWSASERYEMDDAYIDNLLLSGQPISIKINDKQNAQLSLPNLASRQDKRQYFVEELNKLFNQYDKNYSAELVELHTDLPASDTSDTKDGDSYRNRIIINAIFTENKWKTINIGTDSKLSKGTRAIGKHIKAVDWYYINNGFTRKWEGGCCRAKYYDYINNYEGHGFKEPSSSMKDIDTVPGGLFFTKGPVRENNFRNSYKCQILRNNFATYDDYLDSMMIKYPCSAGGVVTEFPSGKENTYKLANCTFLRNITGKPEHLYTAANNVASLDVNGPKLTAGNWWLPSIAEMAQIMRDITYDTSFWDSKPDIVNRVIDKIKQIDSNWTHLSATANRWTSCRYAQYHAYYYRGEEFYDYGTLYFNQFYNPYTVTPITIYEF